MQIIKSANADLILIHNKVSRVSFVGETVHEITRVSSYETLLLDRQNTEIAHGGARAERGASKESAALSQSRAQMLNKTGHWIRTRLFLG